MVTSCWDNDRPWPCWGSPFHRGHLSWFLVGRRSYFSWEAGRGGSFVGSARGNGEVRKCLWWLPVEVDLLWSCPEQLLRSCVETQSSLQHSPAPSAALWQPCLSSPSDRRHTPCCTWPNMERIERMGEEKEVFFVVPSWRTETIQRHTMEWLIQQNDCGT